MLANPCVEINRYERKSSIKSIRAIFLKRQVIDSSALLFDADNSGVVATKEIGQRNRRYVLCRSIDMENLNTLFAYPEEIRKAIYTTNAIESLNSVIRKGNQKAESLSDG